MRPPNHLAVPEAGELLFKLTRQVQWGGGHQLAKDRLNALGYFHVFLAKQLEPANTDFTLDLLEFLVSGDEGGFAVLRECRGKAIRVGHSVARLE